MTVRSLSRQMGAFAGVVVAVVACARPRVPTVIAAVPADAGADAKPPPPLEAYATWEVKPVEPVPGEVTPPSADDVEAARRRATVLEGDLTLPSKITLHGPCWDPRKHAAVEMGVFDPDVVLSFGDDLSFDLDGDGKPDLLLNGGSRVWFTTYRLYVMRGECGYFVGTIETAGELKTAKGATKGLRNLESAWGCGDHGGAGAQHARWSFDGTRYSRAARWTDGGAKRCNDPENY